MSRNPVRIGTRGSALARAQAAQVSAAFERDGRPTKLVIVETEGDRRAPDTAWGEGAFVSAIEQALLDGRVDVAVHSAKDVPTDEDPRLRLAAYLPRADPRDALVVRDGSAARTLAALPSGSRVGTDSPRRTGFVRARRPDLLVHPLHGNVDTRLRRLDEGETDALVLAVAGLTRLGRGERIAEILDPEIVPPAPGQGAIAVQIRATDARLIGMAAAIDDGPTRLVVEAERSFLSSSGGGCRAPIGALATTGGGRLRLLGGYASPDGSVTAVEVIEGAAQERERIVAELVERLGASVPGVGRRPGGVRPRVLVTRAAGQAGELVEALAARDLAAIAVPAIEIQPAPPDDLRASLARVSDGSWLVVTSTNAAAAMVRGMTVEPRDGRDGHDGHVGRHDGHDGHVGRHDGHDGCRWAAVGPATARVLAAAGISGVWQPTDSSAAGMARELPVVQGDHVVVARAEGVSPGLVEGLVSRGATVLELATHRTIEGPEDSRQLLRAALDGGPIAAVLFASGSAVRGLLALSAPEATDRCRTVPAICIGPGTAAVARDHGFQVIGEAADRDIETLAGLAADLLRPAAGVLR